MEFKIGKYVIDPILFEKGYRHGHGPHACETICCASGVFCDVKERDVILSHKERIKDFMDETQTKDEQLWFESKEFNDLDFNSGRAVGTEIFNNKCVFLKATGECSIQLMGMTDGLGAWTLKPFYCIAFPIVVCDGVLTFDDYRQGETKCCSIVDESKTSLVESCRAELIYILGEEGYRELCVMKAAYLAGTGIDSNLRG